jgi:hypothetical protein
MADFYTRSKANDGIKVDLYLPNGEATDHFIRIRGIDSDQFRDTDTKVRRSAIKIVEIDDEELKEEMIKDSHLDILVSLVIDWSFDDECNPANIKQLFTEAPQIADTVDRAAAKRSLFFDNGLNNLENLQKQSSNLIDPQKDQK